MARTLPLSPSVRRPWSTMSLRSRLDGVDAETVRRWLADLPPAIGYRVTVRPLRYRTAPHLAAACWYEDRLIELQVPLPFRAFTERVYYRARRKPGRRLSFRWYARSVRFRTRRDVLRFLYCHEFYHWYLRVVRGRKAAAETACDRFALAYFRRRNQRVDWATALPGYSLQPSRPVRRSA